MPVEHAPSTPAPVSGRSRPLAIALVLAVVAVTALVVAYLLISDDRAAHLAVVPPALVAVDAAFQVAVGGGAVWGDHRESGQADRGAALA